MSDITTVTDSASRRNVEDLIEAFKKEVSIASVTPLRDGTLLRKILDLTKEESDALEYYIALQAQKTAGIDTFGSIDVKDLDSFIDNRQQYANGLLPERCVVFKDNVVVGVLDTFSVPGASIVTQVLTTHLKLVNGELSVTDFNSSKVYSYFRMTGSISSLSLDEESKPSVVAEFPIAPALSNWQLILPDLVSQLADGLMSAKDKKKLDGIDENANAYKLPTATDKELGGVKSSATGKTPDRDYKVEVNPDGTMKTNVPWTDTKYNEASQQAPGLMSVSDKKKLDGIDEKANAYKLPTATDKELGGVKSSATGKTAERDYNVEVNSDGTMKVNVPWIAYKRATQKEDGLFPAEFYNKISVLGQGNFVGTAYLSDLYDVSYFSHRQYFEKYPVATCKFFFNVVNWGIDGHLIDDPIVGTLQVIPNIETYQIVRILTCCYGVTDGNIDESIVYPYPRTYYQKIQFDPDQEGGDGEVTPWVEMGKSSVNLRDIDAVASFYDYMENIVVYDDENNKVGDLLLKKLEDNFPYQIFITSRLINSSGVLTEENDPKRVHVYSRKMGVFDSVLRTIPWVDLTPDVAASNKHGLMSAEDKRRLDQIWEFYNSLPANDGQTWGVMNRKPEIVAGAGEEVCVYTAPTAQSLVLESWQAGKLVTQGADPQTIEEMKKILGEDDFNLLAAGNVATMELRPSKSLEQQISEAREQYFAQKEYEAKLKDEYLAHYMEEEAEMEENILADKVAKAEEAEGIDVEPDKTE